VPRGQDFKISLKEARAAHEAHMAGWSLRALGRMHYREWGYASPGSAASALTYVFRALDLPTRDRITATVEASTVHGNNRRGMGDPAHPEHDRFLAHRRHVRRRKREQA
jgi:hypothetical protein